MTAADHGDYVVHGELPRLDRPVLVVAMAGWIDAGGAAAAAMAEITSTCSIQPLATFDADLFIDYRARRPVMELRDGVNTRLVWSEIQLGVGADPQGHPVLMQAGSSPRGRDFAARWAEVVFTVQQELPLMQEFYADMKQRVAAQGRDPAHCAILPALDVITAATEEQAREQADHVDSLASVELGLQTLCDLTGVDLRSFPLDAVFADIPVEHERIVSVGLYQNVCEIRKDGRPLTLREAALLYATTWMAPRIVGTPEAIADHMQEIFEADACDGFVIGTSSSPMGLRNFVDLVVPELGNLPHRIRRAQLSRKPAIVTVASPWPSVVSSAGALW